MDHDATREQLELAAVEPGGIDRLIAGDTATAQAVAAHLAGCPDCADELARLQRASRLIRAVVREQPPADLRDRTLVRVRAMGRDRTARPGDVTAAPATAGAPVASAVRPAPADGPPPVSPRAPRRGVALGWAAAIAAAVVLSVAATSSLVGGPVAQRPGLQ